MFIWSISNVTKSLFVKIEKWFAKYCNLLISKNIITVMIHFKFSITSQVMVNKLHSLAIKIQVFYSYKTFLIIYKPRVKQKLIIILYRQYVSKHHYCLLASCMHLSMYVTVVKSAQTQCFFKCCFLLLLSRHSYPIGILGCWLISAFFQRWCLNYVILDHPFLLLIVWKKYDHLQIKQYQTEKINLTPKSRYTLMHIRCRQFK